MRLAILLFFALLGFNEAFQAVFVPSTLSRGIPLFAETDELRKGTVKWFNTMKGFGFIMPTDDSGDVFVHQTAIQAEGFRSLADGEEVEYFEELDQNGRKRAIKVTGPGGQDVQGAPFRPSPDYDNY